MTSNLLLTAKILLTVKDKAQHAVILDKATSDKLYKDVQSYRLVTIATLVDRLKINGSLARKCLKDLEEKGQIKQVVGHSKMKIYSMSYAPYDTQQYATCLHTNVRKFRRMLTRMIARALGASD